MKGQKEYNIILLTFFINKQQKTKFMKKLFLSLSIVATLLCSCNTKKDTNTLRSEYILKDDGTLEKIYPLTLSLDSVKVYRMDKKDTLRVFSIDASKNGSYVLKSDNDTYYLEIRNGFFEFGGVKFKTKRRY